MKINKVMETVTNFFTEHIKPPFRFTSIQSVEKGWTLQVEVVEEKEYMQKYARDQLIGLYDVTLDEDMEVTSFNRIDMRSRSIPYSEGGR